MPMRLRDSTQRHRPGRYAETDEPTRIERPAFVHPDVPFNPGLAKHCAWETLDPNDHDGPGPSRALWEAEQRGETAPQQHEQQELLAAVAVGCSARKRRNDDECRISSIDTEASFGTVVLDASGEKAKVMSLPPMGSQQTRSYDSEFVENDDPASLFDNLPFGSDDDEGGFAPRRRSAKLIKGNKTDWNSLSDATKYVIVKDMTDEYSFTQATKLLSLSLDEVAEFIELYRHNKTLSEDYEAQLKTAADEHRHSSDGQPLDLTSIPEPEFLTHRLTGGELERGCKFLYFMGLNKFAAVIGRWRGTSMGFKPIDLDRKQADGLDGLIPHFSMGLADVSVPQPLPQPLPQPQNEASTASSVVMPPGTINPKMLHDHSIIGFSLSPEPVPVEQGPDDDVSVLALSDIEEVEEEESGQGLVQQAPGHESSPKPSQAVPSQPQGVPFHAQVAAIRAEDAQAEVAQAEDAQAGSQPKDSSSTRGASRASAQPAAAPEPGPRPPLPIEPGLPTGRKAAEARDEVEWLDDISLPPEDPEDEDYEPDRGRRSTIRRRKAREAERRRTAFRAQQSARAARTTSAPSQGESAAVQLSRRAASAQDTLPAFARQNKPRAPPGSQLTLTQYLRPKPSEGSQTGTQEDQGTRVASITLSIGAPSQASTGQGTAAPTQNGTDEVVGDARGQAGQAAAPGAPDKDKEGMTPEPSQSDQFPTRWAPTRKRPASGDGGHDSGGQGGPMGPPAKRRRTRAATAATAAGPAGPVGAVGAAGPAGPAVKPSPAKPRARAPRARAPRAPRKTNAVAPQPAQDQSGATQNGEASQAPVPPAAPAKPTPRRLLVEDMLIRNPGRSMDELLYGQTFPRRPPTRTRRAGANNSQGPQRPGPPASSAPSASFAPLPSPAPPGGEPSVRDISYYLRPDVVRNAGEAPQGAQAASAEGQTPASAVEAPTADAPAADATTPRPSRTPGILDGRRPLRGILRSRLGIRGGGGLTSSSPGVEPPQQWGQRVKNEEAEQSPSVQQPVGDVQQSSSPWSSVLGDQMQSPGRGSRSHQSPAFQRPAPSHPTYTTSYFESQGSHSSPPAQQVPPSQQPTINSYFLPMPQPGPPSQQQMVPRTGQAGWAGQSSEAPNPFISAYAESLRLPSEGELLDSEN